MTRVVAVIALLFIGAGTYWAITRDTHAKNEVIRLEREGSISDAIDNDAGLGWRDRLRNAAE